MFKKFRMRILILKEFITGFRNIFQFIKILKLHNKKNTITVVILNTEKLK